MKKIKKIIPFMLALMVLFSGLSTTVEAKSKKKSDFTASIVYHTTNIINAKEGHKEKPGIKVTYKKKNIKTTPKNINKKKVTGKAQVRFSSSNPKVASIDKKTGVLKCKKSGKTTVTMHVYYRPSKKFHFDGDVSAEITVNIKE